ncbi:hypothetical protein BofuT4_uP054290.1 [Botrytis cinerea T4]|uniref:Uncharacterized protein n=1 Tax=Botryotinia fuckeliana (strain T4) TaxID=999810 RepID=G2XVK8_BOTF4|nr:hypothetical protein BofuT4_uP054290.1 [Botrytis cinerea T4]
MYNQKVKLEDEEEFVIVVSCFFWLIVVFVITVSSESYDSTRLNELTARKISVNEQLRHTITPRNGEIEPDKDAGKWKRRAYDDSQDL